MSETTTPSTPPPPPGADRAPLPPPPRVTPAVAAGATNFVVTTPQSEVKLGEDRAGELAVSVSNITGRPLHVALHLVPTEPAKPEWFTIDGEAEREFALGETESYTVRIKVPDTVATGTYSVRGDAVAEDAPQEVFTTGPTVAVAVSAPPKRKPFPWWIVAAATAAVVLIGVIVFAVTRGGGTAVPDVTNVAGSQAIGALRAAGFETDPAAAAVNPCDAPVATQDPATGDADDGSTVTLTFATCNQIRTTPNLVGQPASNIANLANRLGFNLEVIQAGTAVACNPPVTQQVPPPNTRTNTGATMVLIIPAEPAGCTIVSALPPADEDRLAFFPGLGA